MPYVSVWIDESDCPECDCPECDECKMRADDDEAAALEIVREWYLSKQRHDFNSFDEFLQRNYPREYDFVIYGSRSNAPPRKIEPAGAVA